MQPPRQLQASTEREIFDILKLPYREPWERNCWSVSRVDGENSSSAHAQASGTVGQMSRGSIHMTVRKRTAHHRFYVVFGMLSSNCTWNVQGWVLGTYSPHYFGQRQPITCFFPEDLSLLFKALLHCAISSATCNATLKNVFVAVAEVRCYTVQRNWATCNDSYRESLAKVATGAPGSGGRWSVGFTKKSTHARGKLRCKLLEGCYTVQRQLQVATIVAKSRTGF